MKNRPVALIAVVVFGCGFVCLGFWLLSRAISLEVSLTSESPTHSHQLNRLIEEQSDGDNQRDIELELTDEDVENLTLKYVFQERSNLHSDLLPVVSNQRPRTDHTILRLLRDESQRQRLQQEVQTALEPVSPFGRIALLILDSPPEGTAELVIPYFASKSLHIRKAAAELLGSTGSKAAIETLKSALNAPEFEVRTNAVMGLKRACDGMRLSREDGVTLVDGLRSYLTSQRPDGRSSFSRQSEASDVLLHIDPENSVMFFSSPEFFRLDNEALADVIHSTIKVGALLPREALLSLIDSADSEDNRRVLTEALHALGCHQREEDLQKLTKFSEHSEKRIAIGAAEGLAASSGLLRLRDRLWDVEHNATLNDRQRIYLAVKWLDIEVRNGGFSQYFFNSSGNQWESARTGLSEIGAIEHSNLLNEAIGIFGSNGPSSDRKERFEQLRTIESKSEVPFEKMDDRYYDLTENLEVLLLKYAIKHVDAFR